MGGGIISRRHRNERPDTVLAIWGCFPGARVLAHGPSKSWAVDARASIRYDCHDLAFRRDFKTKTFILDDGCNAVCDDLHLFLASAHGFSMVWLGAFGVHRSLFLLKMQSWSVRRDAELPTAWLPFAKTVDKLRP